jgi:hypothetical protein
MSSTASALAEKTRPTGSKRCRCGTPISRNKQACLVCSTTK